MDCTITLLFCIFQSYGIQDVYLGMLLQNNGVYLVPEKIQIMLSKLPILYSLL